MEQVQLKSGKLANSRIIVNVYDAIWEAKQYIKETYGTTDTITMEYWDNWAVYFRKNN